MNKVALATWSLISEVAVWPIGVPRERQANGIRHANPKKQSYVHAFRMNICCVLPTWWLSRGGRTRSHSEHGRETPQRQWYFVSRRGRVGRCQVCKTQQTSSQSHFGPADTKGRIKRPFCIPGHKTIRQTPRASLTGDKSPSAICSGSRHHSFPVMQSR